MLRWWKPCEHERVHAKKSVSELFASNVKQQRTHRRFLNKFEIVALETELVTCRRGLAGRHVRSAQPSSETQ